MISDAVAAGSLASGQEVQQQLAMDAAAPVAKSDHSSSSYKNQHGNYPKWMSRNKVEKLKKVSKKKVSTKKLNKKKAKV